MQPDIYATKAGMNCPLDGSPLQMTERQGIEIDYCPTCRGVWLDRGELEKIIERNAAEFNRAASLPPTPPNYVERPQSAPQYTPPPQQQPQYAPPPVYAPQPAYDPHHVPVHHDPHHDVHHEERRHHGGGWLGGLFGG